MSDFEVLLDTGQEWTLRQSLSNKTFRTTQEDRIRLIREYLRRVAHNVEAIHLWIAGEYELIKDKDRSSYSEKDALVLEALQLAIDPEFIRSLPAPKYGSGRYFECIAGQPCYFQR